MRLRFPSLQVLACWVLATFSSMAFAGVTVSSPGGGASVGSPVHFVAQASAPGCSKGVSAMGIYTAPYKLAYVVKGASLNTTLNLGSGTYNVVVQEWDNCGKASKTPVKIVVGGVISDPPVKSNSFANLNIDSHWNGYALLPPGYFICDTCVPGGPKASWSTQQGIKSPSLSGSAMKFSIGGKMQYSDILWNNKFTSRLSDPKSVGNYHHFTYDVYFYGTNLEISQGLEFDINQFVGNKSYIWGHECRIAGGHQWDTWNNQAKHWVPSGIPCHPKSNAWNHLVIQAERTNDNHLIFDTITLNGYTAKVNRTDTPTNTTWYGMTINYQMDGNKNQEPYSVYLDKINFTYY